MPKLKTHKGAAKRFKITSKGKMRRKKVNMSHILEKKSKKRKRHLRKQALVTKTEFSKIRKLIGR